MGSTSSFTVSSMEESEKSPTSPEVPVVEDEVVEKICTQEVIGQGFDIGSSSKKETGVEAIEVFERVPSHVLFLIMNFLPFRDCVNAIQVTKEVYQDFEIKSLFIDESLKGRNDMNDIYGGKSLTLNANVQRVYFECISHDQGWSSEGRKGDLNSNTFCDVLPLKNGKRIEKRGGYFNIFCNLRAVSEFAIHRAEIYRENYLRIHDWEFLEYTDGILHILSFSYFLAWKYPDSWKVSRQKNQGGVKKMFEELEKDGSLEVCINVRSMYPGWTCTMKSGVIAFLSFKGW